MKFKKLLIMLLVFTVMVTSLAFANETISEKEYEEGEIVSFSVDANLYRNKIIFESETMDMDVASYSFASTPPKFWVDWFGGGSFFSSNYIHYQLTHRSSCNNRRNEYVTSEWVPKIELAYSSTNATIDGNLANYDYRQ